MEHLLDHFPVFEANQVLMSGHLNVVFDYLDQQTRQTRSHLIGIGIVCGLESAFDASSNTIVLSKGCGVTSEGYLIVEPDDISLTSYRGYVIPPDLEYPTLENVPLWELFPAGEPQTTALGTPANFLNDKAVLLFLELKKQGLRNCSPNNCDDKGSQVTATVRRLLIRTSDLDAIIAGANDIETGLTASDIDDVLSARLNLPDLHFRRFDVINTGPVTSADVYGAFLSAFHAVGLANATSKALGAAYDAFKPLLADAHPANPFGAFTSAYGFLDGAPANADQVRFLQYYTDLFDDMLRAYDEFRWKAADLICMCCPPVGLFPRHLMLGDLFPPAGNPGHHRQAFMPSPAISGCAETSKTLVQLFSRLVEMTLRFTNAPSLPKPDNKAPIDPQIRITPSRLGDFELGNRAIPYYYEQTGSPPLYRLWDPQKTRRKRANQNLGYRSDEFAPPAPAFVTDALGYDLEPYNFFRVEGHLGKPYEGVMESLLTMKTRYRLPVDFIAVRTGPYDDKQPIDLSKELGRFQDLEALYDALREELLAALAEGTREIYDIVIGDSKLPGGVPQNPLLKSHAPDFRYSAGRIGAWYEQNLNRFLSMPYVDVDQDNIDANAVLMVYCALFAGTTGLPSGNFPHVVSLYYFMKLSQILPASLDALAYGDFENKCEDLLGLVRYFRTDAAKQVANDLQAFLPQDELMDLCEGVLFNCQIDPIKSVHEEYVRRIGDLKKQQFLATFLRQHPGVQHKAGVPAGGTFIVVYHGNPPAGSAGSKTFAAGLAGISERQPVGNFTISKTSSRATTAKVSDVVVNAIGRIRNDKLLALNADINVLLGALGSAVSGLGGLTLPKGLDDTAAKIIAETVANLPDGTVIADFYLPYRLCGDGPAIQYVLPKPTPAFTVGIGCANDDEMSSVEVIAKGGIEPYDIAVDDQGYQALAGPLTLVSGTHVLTLRDADGTESAPQTITVPMPIRLAEPKFTCAAGRFTADISISGGVPPYAVNGESISGNSFTTDPAESGANVLVEVQDTRGCTAKTEFTHTCPPPCNLPCAGATIRRGYRFWIPDPDPQLPYKSFALNDLVFSVESEPGKEIDLSDRIKPIVKANANALKPARFPDLVKKWITQINNVIASVAELNEPGKAQWLTLDWESNGPGQFGTLWIEHFDCLGFDIRIQTGFSNGISERKLDIIYARDSNVVRVDDAEANAPPFEGVMFDKCNPDEKPVPFCPDKPDFALQIPFDPADLQVFAEVVVIPDTPNLDFFWEVRDGQPAVGNGKKFSTTFARAGTYDFLVTAYTEKGCRVVATKSIKVG